MARERLVTLGLVATALLGSLAIAPPAQAIEDTAIMRFASAEETVAKGSTVRLSVRVDTGGQDVNAVRFSGRASSGTALLARHGRVGGVEHDDGTGVRPDPSHVGR